MALQSRVTSPDGTPIAYWSTGKGDPLVLVHGAPADHTRWQPLLPYLEPHFTVHAVDRRGRGGSGDAAGYAFESEFEDIATVVDAIAEAAGTTVSLYGHSLGGMVVFGAAILTSNVRRLVLYEGWPLPDPSALALPAGLAERMDERLAAGDRDAVVELLFRGLEDLSDEDMAAFKAAPSWAGRVAAAHTITRELRGAMTVRLDPASARTIAVPTLLITGENSPDPARPSIEAVAAVLGDAYVLELAGEEHVADVLEPERFASHIVPFLRGEG